MIVVDTQKIIFSFFNLYVFVCLQCFVDLPTMNAYGLRVYAVADQKHFSVRLAQSFLNALTFCLPLHPLLLIQTVSGSLFFQVA